MANTRARTRSAPAARMSQSARAHLRRYLRRAGLRASELDATTYETLRSWATALAAEEHGAARLLLQDVAQRMDGRIREPGESEGGYELTGVPEEKLVILREGEAILRDVEAGKFREHVA